jgi:hypothetical protein
MHKVDSCRVVAAALLAVPLALPCRAGVPDGTLVEVSGVLHVIAVDDFVGRSSHLVYEVVDERSGAKYRLKLIDPAHRDLQTGARVSVMGAWSGSSIAVHGGGLVPMAGQQPPMRTAVTGARRAVALLVNLADASFGANCSPGVVADELFNTVDKFYREASFGQVSFPADVDGDGQPDVLGPFRLPDTIADVKSGQVDYIGHAKTAIAATGVDLSRWQHEVFIFPFESQVRDLGEVGCGGDSCFVQLSAWPVPIPVCVDPGVIAHELGHNLGMWHAGLDANNDGQVDPGEEYGDGSDVMGAGHCSSDIESTFHPNAPHKDLLGWFDAFPGSVLDVPAAPGPFVYTLSAEEFSPAGETEPEALRLDRSLYLSTRQHAGFDANMDDCSFNRFPQHVGRTNVHRYGFAPPSSDTLLLATLADGESFEDRVSSARVTQLSHTDHTVTVQVTRHQSLFLNQSRFRVDAAWKTADGRAGVALATQLTDDTGYFWFFADTNVEVVTKVLDACSLGGFWVFAAGLTDVEVRLTVTDTRTGRFRTYINPQGKAFAPIQDTGAFTCGAAHLSSAVIAREQRMPQAGPASGAAAVAPAAVAPAAFSPCGADATTLCLDGGRFKVEATWTAPTGEAGSGQAVALTDDTGYFWFFSETNVEMIVKVLNGCAVNQKFWVFAGGLTNVHVVMKVTDTYGNTSRSYINPQSTAFAPIQDTAAFSGCP